MKGHEPILLSSDILGDLNAVTKEQIIVDWIVKKICKKPTLAKRLINFNLWSWCASTHSVPDPQKIVADVKVPGYDCPKSHQRDHQALSDRPPSNTPSCGREIIALTLWQHGPLSIPHQRWYATRSAET